MSATAPPQAPPASELGLPVAAIVCLAVTGYVALILIIIVVKNILVNRGVCTCESPCSAKDGQDQSQCCSGPNLADTCNCCASPSVNSCVNAICPAKKSIGIMDILLCQCCCGDDTANVCSCIHLDLDFEIRSLNCCCFTLHLVKADQPQPWSYSSNPSPQPGLGYPPLQPGVRYPPFQPGVNYPPLQPGGSYPPVLPGGTYPPVHSGAHRPSVQSGANISMNNSTKNVNSSLLKSFNRTHPSVLKSSAATRHQPAPQLQKDVESAKSPRETTAHGDVTCLTLKEVESNISLRSKRSLMEVEGRTMDKNNSAKRMNLDLATGHHTEDKHVQVKSRRTRVSITNLNLARSRTRPDSRCPDTHRVSQSSNPATRQ